MCGWWNWAPWGILTPFPVKWRELLGIKEQAGQPMHETLVEALSDRSVLVVLDNCERLIRRRVPSWPSMLDSGLPLPAPSFDQP